MEILDVLLRNIGEVWSYTWWFLLPIILFFIARDQWLIYIRVNKIKSMEWITLELSVPDQVLKTPKAMEQVFSSLYSIYSFGRFKKFLAKWVDGDIDEWISFEIVGMDRSMHFYIRTPKKYQNLVETSIYSQFPDAEITEVEDYMERLPDTMPNSTYDMWGAEFGFVKDNVYPIKTYPSFEEDIDERRIDPVASLAEVMSRLNPDEYVLMQFVFSPAGKVTGQDLEKEGKEEVDDILGVKKKEKPKGNIIINFFDGIFEFLMNLALALFRDPVWKSENGKDDEKKDKDFGKISKGQSKIIENIENKFGKPFFETSIRVIYVDRRDSFTRLNVAAIMGYFNQFNTPSLNSFKPKLAGYNKPIGRVFPFLKKMLSNASKRNMYFRYKYRFLGIGNHVNDKEKHPILSTEELATMFHFPITGVEAPSLRRLSSKKGEPPSTLPIK